MLKQSYFLIMIKVVDEAIRRNYLKDLGWISENLHSVTEIKNRRHMKFIV